ncbi:MAG TPA: ATP synthase F1 subunit epsilon [Bdellovibrionota bacterium]|nr:ATP synthase F1 subunit epsilon [Bdellovibrionota bacterium]
MAGEITLHIVTPTARLLSTRVDEVVIPAAKGDMGILPGHTPILTFLGVGLLTYVKEGTSHSLSIKQGFAEVKNDEVIILTDQAFKPGEVDAELAEGDG